MDQLRTEQQDYRGAQKILGQDVVTLPGQVVAEVAEKMEGRGREWWEREKQRLAQQIARENADLWLGARPWVAVRRQKSVNIPLLGEVPVAKGWFTLFVDEAGNDASIGEVMRESVIPALRSAAAGLRARITSLTAIKQEPINAQSHVLGARQRIEKRYGVRGR